MENYIVINGKKAELTQEQLKALGLEREITHFTRANNEKHYYHIDDLGKVIKFREEYTSVDDKLFNVANYCTDKEMMQQRAYAETLNRLLWRYSMEHKGNEINWEENIYKYNIIYRHIQREWEIACTIYYRYIGVPYFYSREIAEAAIKEIVEPFMAEHPDFKPF